MDLSSRISIRPMKLSDIDDFLSWASDERVTRNTRQDTIRSKEQALSHFENVVTRHPWYRLICMDDRAVGFLSVKPESGEDRCRGHASYGLRADQWGRGITTAALRSAIPLVFDELKGLVRVEAMVVPENVGSQKVLEKVGFFREGFLRKYGFCKGEIRDVLIYSFLVNDKIRIEKKNV